MSGPRFREDLALHVEAMGYPLAAEVIRAGDELPEVDPDAVYSPLEELPAPAGQEALGI